MKEIIKEIIEFDLDEGRMDYLDDMIDVFSKDGCEMVDTTSSSQRAFDMLLKCQYRSVCEEARGQQPPRHGDH